MFPQTPTISLFIVLASLVLCNGYYIQEPFYKTNVKHYLVHDGRLIKTKHEHFGLLTRANRAIHLSSSRPRGTVSVDDFGAKADGRDDSEVAYHVINKKDKIFTCKFSSFSISFNFLLFLAILLVLQAFGSTWTRKCYWLKTIDLIFRYHEDSPSRTCFIPCLPKCLKNKKNS